MGSDINGWRNISKEGGGLITKSGYHKSNGAVSDIKGGGGMSEVRYFTLLFDHIILNTFKNRFAASMY